MVPQAKNIVERLIKAGQGGSRSERFSARCIHGAMSRGACMPQMLKRLAFNVSQRTPVVIFRDDRHPPYLRRGNLGA
jgi:hypothetical protein